MKKRHAPSTSLYGKDRQTDGRTDGRTHTCMRTCLRCICPWKPISVCFIGLIYFNAPSSHTVTWRNGRKRKLRHEAYHVKGASINAQNANTCGNTRRVKCIQVRTRHATPFKRVYVYGCVREGNYLRSLARAIPSIQKRNTRSIPAVPIEYRRSILDIR